MPVPQENSLFVEQASCLFIKSLLRMVQHFRCNGCNGCQEEGRSNKS
ncbi:hypothetical protein [Microcoleus vaginatus]